MISFPALVIDTDGAQFKTLQQSDLPQHEVLVEISHSSLNYKDGLAITGTAPIARRMPLVGGIDLAGTVVESSSDLWKAGDRVLVNGWGLSETEWGGYARYARLKPEWLTRIPEAFSAGQAMAIGTAGYTAALCVNALEGWGLTPDAGEVLVTGASGGVGSVAVSILAAKGYAVAASTGSADAHAMLSELGAKAIIARDELSVRGKPLQKERWPAAIDSVGGTTLANILSQTRYGGAVACCGMVGGNDLPASVFPHILRSVALLGVDSVYAPQSKRDAAWQTLSEWLDRGKLERLMTVHPMSALLELAQQIIAGKTLGRVVIEIG